MCNIDKSNVYQNLSLSRFLFLAVEIFHHSFMRLPESSEIICSCEHTVADTLASITMA